MAQHPTSYARLSLDQSRIMGVINVTPDSFSDAGEVFAQVDAVARGKAMVEAGVDILDVGGESTRPGAQEISISEELDRVIPVIEGLLETGVILSVDTRHAEVMAGAIQAGAHIINDVTALTGEPKSLEVVANLGCPVILMHMQGEPGTMQNAPMYEDAPREVSDYLAKRIKACEAAGIARSQIAIDPGIGFGKTVDHNLQIIKQIERLHEHGCAIVLGVSRKRFIGLITDTKNPQGRLPGSLAAAVYARTKGVQIFRVHDVAESKQALLICDYIQSA
ncbi:MAG: dihydropteroate synthase [Rhodospirillales bacterium]|jgi:dihydropteroate synthase